MSSSSSGEIPRSDALSEAPLDSLAESIERFDRRISAGETTGAGAEADLDRIIESLQVQRLRWEAADAAGEKPQKAARASSAKVPLGKKIVGKSLEDLGL